MADDDAYYATKEDIVRSLEAAQELYQRWCLLQSGHSLSTRTEQEWTSTELCNTLRSIEWDLGDLAETINQIAANQSQYGIDERTLQERCEFVEKTRKIVQRMKDDVSGERTIQISSTAQSAAGAAADDQDVAYRPTVYTTRQADGSKAASPKGKYDDLLGDSREQVTPTSSTYGDGNVYGHSLRASAAHSTSNEQDIMLDDLIPETSVEIGNSRVSAFVRRGLRRAHLHTRKRQCIAASITIVLLVLLIVLIAVLSK